MDVLAAIKDRFSPSENLAVPGDRMCRSLPRPVRRLAWKARPAAQSILQRYSMEPSPRGTGWALVRRWSCSDLFLMAMLTGPYPTPATRLTSMHPYCVGFVNSPKGHPLPCQTETSQYP